MANGILGTHPSRPYSDQANQESPVRKVSPTRIDQQSILLRQAPRLHNTERYDWRCLGFLAGQKIDPASGWRHLCGRVRFEPQLCQAPLFDGSQLAETLRQPPSDRISLCCTTWYKSPEFCAVRWVQEAYRTRRSRRPH